MEIVRPELLELGGEDSFDLYQREFDRLYRAAPILDVLGRQVIFPQYACRHVCFKSDGDDPYGNAERTAWSQERAERIGWISVALTRPDEVRPSHQTSGNQAYLLRMAGDPSRSIPQEVYAVYVRIEGKGAVTFQTAFSMERRYYQDARKGGATVYPPPPAPKAGKGKKQRKKR